MRGPAEIVMVSGFIPPALYQTLSRMPNHRAHPSGLEHPTRSLEKRQTSKNVVPGVPATGGIEASGWATNQKSRNRKAFAGPILANFREADFSPASSGTPAGCGN
jgi:hypothetical protein